MRKDVINNRIVAEDMKQIYDNCACLEAFNMREVLLRIKILLSRGPVQKNVFFITDTVEALFTILIHREAWESYNVVNASASIGVGTFAKTWSSFFRS